ncbi:L-aspartate oxidase [Flavobacterium orientale]|uniref:L-aspartate oxidase n=1 Tax=Flavobacterium orientale TaxID=1756020 RepID=A0A916Y8R6_9FLAO|nr:L-aspartate oxidase [Flavobacterium orientale]GGD34460.1 L-aspartate oxidase [Flavobacterium orientale]
MKTCDVVISGTGIAGLSLAIQIHEKNPELKIVLLTKKEPKETNTSLAQGGIAAVCNRITDSFEEHITDTLNAGQGKCNKKVVEMVIKQAPQRLNELIKWGAEFDTTTSGNLDLALEGGHRHSRVVHYKDKTGFHIQEVLWAKIAAAKNIEVLANAFCVDIIMDSESEESIAIGMSYMTRNDNEEKAIFAQAIVLATGGSGQLFNYTSNPEIATGDGIAMAFRAGATITNMHYMQYHPTALYEKGKSNLFLISEAVRGFGGHLVNSKGKRFLFDYDTRGELATRDIVSDAITKEIIQSEEAYMYLDVRHVNQEDFKNHFPTILTKFKEIGRNPETDLIPIVPVAHYQCGGIEVNEFGQSDVKNLYALGECSCTGLHGANRLASNSLLEALVYSFNASQQIICNTTQILQRQPVIQNSAVEAHEIIVPKVLDNFKKQVKSLMTYHVLQGSQEEKMKVLTQLIKIHTDLMECEEYYYRCRNCCELENMLQTAMIIINQSSMALHLETNKKREYAFS